VINEENIDMPSEQEEQAFAEELAQVVKSGPKVLVYDIETAPLMAYCWSIWDQNIGLNQIVSDTYILSWSAKWLGAPDSEVMYMDNRNAKTLSELENDYELVKGIWDLLNQADVVITQNGKHFDQRRLNARFLHHNLGPASASKHIDTKQIASKHFGFTSNKLAYMTDKFCTKHKKQEHKKFPGFDLWRECLNLNPEAFAEMEDYNKHDVLALEELYYRLAPWDNTVNFNLYTDTTDTVCSACGGTDLFKNGYAYTSNSKFQKYRCKSCGKETRGKVNMFTADKRASLQQGIT
jgi:hypothetical protein